MEHADENNAQAQQGHGFVLRGLVLIRVRHAHIVQQGI
jgi:hypothetical protein